ncbi:PepSY-associated TM helix domain-containing protein [Dyadobacter beijingensis]|nr:PepSY-associated TM helix domain-containing protein [Dyadobacter beijingensis]
MEKTIGLKEKKRTARSRPSWLRRFNDWFHLWIGIAAGIPVIIICLTGCLLVFEPEITAMSRSWWNVEIPAGGQPLPPSALREKVVAQLPGMQIRRLWYYGEGKAVKITPDNSNSLLFANPYTGKLLAMQDHEDVFHFIEEGHTNLWLPREIGHQVVSWVTAVFLILTITGIVLWWPKKWNAREMKQALTIQWKAKFKRVNYDLHNVLGFYSLLIALIMTLTGLIMGFQFVNKTVMQMLGAKPRSKEISAIQPGPEAVPATIEGRVDMIFKLVTTEMGEYNRDQISIHFPKDDAKSIYACTDMHHGSWRELNFDRNTLALLSSSQTKVAEDTPAGWMRRSNYALHVGAIGGTLTKWVYFFASFICATLPVTGFIVWFGKQRKKPSRK